MLNKSKIQFSKKQFILVATGLIIIISLAILIVYSLTFLIKNINLIFKPPLNSSDTIHFNLSGAQKLFPNINLSN